jgi:hypothetical protein
VTGVQTCALPISELGRTGEARETLLNAIAITNRATPRNEDWFVFGRIAEQLGDRAAARSCYARVATDPTAPLAAKNLLVPLAKARLAALTEP